MTQFLIFSALSPNDIVAEAFVAEVLARKVKEGGSQTFDVTNFFLNFKSTGTVESFGKYMPVLKGYLIASVIGISVLMIVFMPTPLFSKILATILGLWLWVTIWGICDAIVHRISLNSVYRSFEFVRQNNLGMIGLLVLPERASNALAMLGTFRGMGLMLATLVSGSLMKFAGSHAMAMIAGNLSGKMQAEGEKTAYDTHDPIGSTDLLKKLNTDTIPTMANAQRFGWGNMRDAATNQMARGIGAGSGLGSIDKAFEQGKWESEVSQANVKEQKNLYGTASKMAAWNIADQKSKVSGYGSHENLVASGIQNIKRILGEQGAERLMAKAFGFGDDIAGYNKWKSEGMVLNEQQVQHLIQQGFWGVNPA